MIDLKQKELKEWQDRNFPRSRYEEMTKDQLIDLILIMQFTLGMAEEIGEISHHILKGIQGVRGGVNGIDEEQVADGVSDSLVFGQQLLSRLNVDSEKEISAVIEKVLQRNWTKDPSGEKLENAIQEQKYCECSKKGLVPMTHWGPVSNALICNNCKLPLTFGEKININDNQT